jgi:hypothetical protein
MLKLAVAVLFAGSLQLLAQNKGNSGGSPPPGATALCKDGTYGTNANKSVACRGHQGVKEWYAAAAGKSDSDNKEGGKSSSANAQPNAQRAEPSPAATGAAAGNPGQGSGAKGSSHSVANKTAAPGGGPGMVWLNTDSKVYHCYGTEYYGKTKQGKYVSEQDAKQMGGRPDHGKACSNGK